MDLLEICDSEYLSLDNVKIYFETFPETNPNMTDSHGKSLLHHLCYNKNASMDVFNFIIEKGADIHAVDGIGNLPMHAACYNTNTTVAWEMIKYFIDNDVDICRKNNLGLTPLYVACLNENTCKIFLRYLVLNTVRREKKISESQ
jgi:ankyrin repeat protein